MGGAKGSLQRAVNTPRLATEGPLTALSLNRWEISAGMDACTRGAARTGLLAGAVAFMTERSHLILVLICRKEARGITVSPALSSQSQSRGTPMTRSLASASQGPEQDGERWSKGREGRTHQSSFRLLLSSNPTSGAPGQGVRAGRPSSDFPKYHDGNCTSAIKAHLGRKRFLIGAPWGAGGFIQEPKEEKG